ncbi:MAG: hypothetical protein QW244_03325 [Candidatus Pacearchaeota archaeon]
MAEDKTLRLIVGVILVIIALPSLGMITMMSSMGFGMMWYNNFGFLMMYLTGYLLTIGLLILGIYLIYQGLKE